MCLLNKLTLRAMSITKRQEEVYKYWDLKFIWFVEFIWYVEFTPPNITLVIHTLMGLSQFTPLRPTIRRLKMKKKKKNSQLETQG